MEQTHEQNLQKLGELIKDVKVAMVTTVDNDGGLHSRPMWTHDLPFDGVLWFFTDVNSAKVHELERDHHVSLTYIHPSEEHFVAVSGVARVLRDPEKARSMWKSHHTSRFTSVDDPNLRLVRVEVGRAEYWDSPSSTRTLQFGKATTGKQ